MQPRTTLPTTGRQHTHTKPPQPKRPPNIAIAQQHTPPKATGRTGARGRGALTPLIDAKGAAKLLGVPYTWLLAQARAGKIPHHRLGHYVRFDPNDLEQWLHENKITARNTLTRRSNTWSQP